MNKERFEYTYKMFSKIKKGQKKNHGTWLEQLEAEHPGVETKKARTLDREEVLSLLDRQESSRSSLMKKVTSNQ